MAIIALSVLLQTAPPVPRQAIGVPRKADNSTNGQNAPQKIDSGSDVTAPKLGSSQKAEQPGQKHAPEDERPTIVKVMPVDVSSIKKDRWDYAYIGASVLIAVITLILAGIARTQAKAAKLSAEAVINSQRAWVVASPSEPRPPLGFIPEPGDPIGEPGRDRQNLIYVLFNNVGVTPAKIIQTCVLYITIEKLEMLPQEPQYSGVETHTGVFLFNRKYESGRDEKNGRVAYLWPNQVLTKETIQAVTTQRMFLYAYGFVGYEDAFKRQHTMRFGYVYNFPQPGQPPLNGFLPAGPRKYNEAD